MIKPLYIAIVVIAVMFVLYYLNVNLLLGAAACAFAGAAALNQDKITGGSMAILIPDEVIRILRSIFGSPIKALTCPDKDISDEQENTLIAVSAFLHKMPCNSAETFLEMRDAFAALIDRECFRNAMIKQGVFEIKGDKTIIKDTQNLITPNDDDFLQTVEKECTTPGCSWYYNSSSGRDEKLESNGSITYSRGINLSFFPTNPKELTDLELAMMKRDSSLLKNITNKVIYDWSQKYTYKDVTVIEPSSINTYHKVLILQDLNWQTFNVLTMNSGHTIILEDMCQCATALAVEDITRSLNSSSTTGTSSNNAPITLNDIGLYVNVWPNHSANVLSIHVIDMRGINPKDLGNKISVADVITALKK